MLIFLDTEFTDFIDCDLISIGMVTEDGQHVFYAERNDYKREWESDFVRASVLPHVGKVPAAVCSRDELTQRLWNWFSTLPGQLQIACDSVHDKDLLWGALGDGLPPNLSAAHKEIAFLAETPAFRNAASRYYQQEGYPLHHALHDAQALRHGWLASEK
jgi:hypothetical protein